MARLFNPLEGMKTRDCARGEPLRQRFNFGAGSDAAIRLEQMRALHRLFARLGDTPMNKSFPPGASASIIREKAIYTQEELARELHTRGISATQVTLSRDIRDLGLVKTAEGYRTLPG